MALQKYPTLIAPIAILCIMIAAIWLAVWTTLTTKPEGWVKFELEPSAGGVRAPEGHTVYYRPAGAAKFLTHRSVGPKPDVDIPHLKPGLYEAYVTSYNRYGESAPSPVATFEVTAEGRITNVQLKPGRPEIVTVHEHSTTNTLRILSTSDELPQPQAEATPATPTP